MATSWANVDNNFPFTGDIGNEEDMPQQLKALLNYMYTLTEQLKYTLNNLDATNMNDAALEGFTGGINANVDMANKRTDTALGMIASLNTEIGKTKDRVERLAGTVNEMEMRLRRLQLNVDLMQTGITVDGESITIGGPGKSVALNGDVRVNGQEVETK